ncbi:MAG TPA: DUF222 domain-containing protein, partial [Acidimicrobiia bacterium]|nr:DUF222 domain-containing protein [Acidimicrobiia bacterium]
MFDPLDGVRGEIEKLLASEEPIDHIEMCRIAEQVEFLRLRSMRGYDRSEQWRADGFLSAAAAIRAQTNMNQGNVHASLTLAEKLEDLPETAFAFSNGVISRQHAATIADACTPERIDALREVEEHLVEVARRTQPKQLRGVVRRLADALDGD